MAESPPAAARDRSEYAIAIATAEFDRTLARQRADATGHATHDVAESLVQLHECRANHCTVPTDDPPSLTVLDQFRFREAREAADSEMHALLTRVQPISIKQVGRSRRRRFAKIAY